MNILALGPHPDDIEIGCGATLLKFARAGHKVFLYIATYGELGGDRKIRKQEQIESGEYMGVEKIFWGEFPDCQLPLSRHLITNIEDVINEVNPDYIFVNNNEDTHQDHRVLATATLSATRYVPNVLFYECPSTLNFSPDVYVDIEDYIEGKQVLLEKHASQIDVYVDIEDYIEGKQVLLEKHASQICRAHVEMPDISILEIATSSARFRGIQGRKKSAEAFSAVRLFINIPET